MRYITWLMALEAGLERLYVKDLEDFHKAMISLLGIIERKIREKKTKRKIQQED